MRIYVKSDEQKLPIVMVIPTSAIGWRWVWRMMSGHSSSNDMPRITDETAREIAAALKYYVRKNGHFDLVNVRSANGDRIRIRV